MFNNDITVYGHTALIQSHCLFLQHGMLAVHSVMVMITTAVVATECPFVAPFQNINCWVLILSIYSSSCHRALTLGRTLYISASSRTFFLIGNDIWQKVYWAVTNTDCKGAS